MDRPRRLRVFLAGPLFSGDVCDNVERLNKVERHLVEIGFSTFNPGTMVESHDPMTRSTYESVFESWLDVADVVFRLPGSSDLADKWTNDAILSQIPVFHDVDKLRRWLNEGWLETATRPAVVADYDEENDPEFLDKLTTADIEEIAANDEMLLDMLSQGPYTNAQMSVAWAGIWRFVVDNELSALQFNENDNRSVFECIRDTLQRWKNGHDEALEHTATINASVSTSDKRERLKDERGVVYGDARQNHRGIAGMWAPLLAPHAAEIDALQPIPEWTVALMMAALKVARCRLVFHEDNYDDAANYLDFAQAWQRDDAKEAFEG